jgi:nicotinamide-nucleotide amidase
LKHVIQLVKSRNGEMNDLNVKQAVVPDNCEVIPNSLGTAPGMKFQKDGIVYLFMPGVPFEMKGMMIHHILPWLTSYFSTPAIVHKTLMLQGIAESTLALLIEPWENQLPPLIKLAYLPSPGIIRLRLTAKGDAVEVLDRLIVTEMDKVKPLIQSYLVSEFDEPIEVTLGKLLSLNKKTLSTAESCTGGKIASLVTSVPGSSLYFKGSIVAYSNQVKSNILNVNDQIINDHGAVSRQVVEIMAQNVRKILDTDYSIAISGIAGPDGGSAEKPVGTTWIAVASEQQVISKIYIFGDHRERNIQRASISALNELRELILKEKG